MKTLVRVLVLLLVIAGAVWGWQILFPSEETRVRHRLDEIASAATFSKGENPILRLANAAALGKYFTTDVRVETGAFGPIEGREALMALAARAQPPGGELSVEFVDVAVEIAPDGLAATAHLTAEIHGRDRRDGRATIDARELDVRLAKVADAWLVQRVIPVESIVRP